MSEPRIPGRRPGSIKQFNYDEFTPHLYLGDSLVWTGYSKLVGDNGQKGRYRRELRLAPNTEGEEVLYFEDSTEFYLFGWIDDYDVHIDASFNGVEDWHLEALEKCGLFLSEDTKANMKNGITD